MTHHPGGRISVGCHTAGGRGSGKGEKNCGLPSESYHRLMFRLVLKKLKFDVKLERSYLNNVDSGVRFDNTRIHQCFCGLSSKLNQILKGGDSMKRIYLKTTLIHQLISSVSNARK